MPSSASAQGLGPPPDLSPLPLWIPPFLSGALIPSLPQGSEAEATGKECHLLWELSTRLSPALNSHSIWLFQWMRVWEHREPETSPSARWAGRLECHPFPQQAPGELGMRARGKGPLNMGTCPSGALIRSSGSLS